MTFSVLEGLKKFKIEHKFVVKNIYEYYAKWIREGKLKVSGELTIKDITRPVVLDVTLNKAAIHPMSKAPTIGFDATTSISRTEFGVGAYVPNVGDTVILRITTEASAPKAR